MITQWEWHTVTSCKTTMHESVRCVSLHSHFHRLVGSNGKLYFFFCNLLKIKWLVSYAKLKKWIANSKYKSLGTVYYLNCNTRVRYCLDECRRVTTFPLSAGRQLSIHHKLSARNIIKSCTTTADCLSVTFEPRLFTLTDSSTAFQAANSA